MIFNNFFWASKILLCSFPGLRDFHQESSLKKKADWICLLFNHQFYSRKWTQLINYLSQRAKIWYASYWWLWLQTQQISIRGRVRLSVRPSVHLLVHPSVPCYFRTTKIAVFEVFEVIEVTMVTWQQIQEASSKFFQRGNKKKEKSTFSNLMSWLHYGPE